jgi:hypothetical protein
MRVSSESGAAAVGQQFAIRKKDFKMAGAQGCVGVAQGGDLAVEVAQGVGIGFEFASQGKASREKGSPPAERPASSP